MKRIAPVLGICLLLGGCAARSVQPVTVPLPPPPPSGEPAGVVGLSANDLRIAFGVPAFVRKENGTELWRYDGKDCRAFFFLYIKDGQQVVRHVETLPHARDSAFDPICLELLRARRAPVS